MCQNSRLGFMRCLCFKVSHEVEVPSRAVVSSEGLLGWGQGEGKASYPLPNSLMWWLASLSPFPAELSMELPYNIPQVSNSREKPRQQPQFDHRSELPHRASFMGIWPVKSHRALGLEGPYTWINALLYYLEILDNFWTRNPYFQFALNPTNDITSPVPQAGIFLLNVTQLKLELHFTRWGHLNEGNQVLS